ncbi:MAG: PAS domain-containing protein, partial [Bacillota bacterium]
MKPDSLFAQRLIVAVALVVLGIAAILNYVQEHGRVFNREQDRLQTQAHVIDENLSQNLRALSGVLDNIRLQLPADDPPGKLNRYLKALSDGMPSVRTIAVLNSDGYAIAASRPELVGFRLIGPDYNRRPEFQLAAHSDPDMLYVSPPFRSTLGPIVVGVSRAWTDARGEFAGVVIAALDRNYFAPLLNAIRYASDMKAALVHWDGEVFLTQPERNGPAETNFLQQGDFFQEHRQSGRDMTVLPSVRIGKGDARMMLQRTVKPAGLKMDKPLVVEIDRSIDEIYARWRRDARLFTVLYALILIASLFGLLAYQRKQKEADLREAEAAQRVQASERFMKTITDHLPAMVAYWSDELRCRFANGAHLEWFGKTAQELIGMRIQDLLGDELFRKNEPYIRTALKGERQQFERTLTKADGSIGYTWAQYIPDRVEGKVRGFFVLVSDITPLEEAQRALAESEWKLRTIIETDPECVTLLSADGTVQQMNPAGLAMIGAASGPQIIGTNLGTMIDGQYRPAFNTLLAGVCEGKSGILTFELVGLAGIRRWLECH